MGRDKSAPVVIESKARRARAFIRIEQRGKARPVLRFDIRKRERVEVDGSQETPSFFCRLVEDVVYWNSSFLSG